MTIRIFYESSSNDDDPQVFDDDAIVDNNGKTMCKTLSEEYYDKKVSKVDIQQKDMNDTAWISQGLLVQNIPGGKCVKCLYPFLYNLIEGLLVSHWLLTFVSLKI